MAECTETTEANVVGHERPPKRVLSGEVEGGKGYIGGQERD